MDPRLVRSLILPWLMRRTWPRVQALRSGLEASAFASPEELQARQDAAVRTLVQRAAQASPFYRERWRRLGVDPAAIRGAADLPGLPPLEKQHLKDHREQILCEDVDRSTLTASATGGTTGAPTRYYWDDAYWCASSAVTQRAYGFLDFEPGDRHAMIWGTAFHQSRRAALRERIHNRLRNLLVIPGFELSEATLPVHVRRLIRHRPRLVEGYTSLLMLVSGWILREGVTEPRPRAVVSSAEKLHPWQRETIERAFGAPVFDRYGTREVGCIAAECPAREGLHVSAEHVVVEIVRGDSAVRPGESGEILVTCLANAAFPFIRYRIGDMGRLLSRPCSCGRSLPLLELTAGRVHDLLTTARGGFLPGEFFPHLFKEYSGVHSFHVHQRQDRSVHVRIVKTAAWTPEQEADWRREIARVLGDLPVSYEDVDRIETTAAGKLRFTSSEVPVDLVQQRMEAAAP
jgi:phenylacetate-CoA ligase